MKFRSLAFLSVLTFLVCSFMVSAQAKTTSIMAIDGSVFYNDGATLVPDGWNVDVTNKTQAKTLSSKTGEAGLGRYSVTFMDILGGIVAATGDEVEVVVTGADGNKHISTYILTDNDIDASSATINVINGPVPPKPITKLVISGMVCYKDGKTPASGLTVKALETSSTTNGEGKYSVTIEKGGAAVANSGDEIVITVEKEGKEVGKASRILGTPKEDGSLTIEVNVITNLTAPPASSSLLAIEGTIFLKDGTVGPDGLTVEINNKTQNLSLSSTTGDAGPGRYSVTFMDILGGLVAVTGDEIDITVIDASGNKKANIVYQLTTADVLENKVAVNVTLDVTQKLTISGAVYAKDGRTPVPDGWAVKVANHLKVDATTTKGKYSVTLETMEPGKFVAGIGEKIVVTVADADGKTIGSVTHILSDAEVVVNKAAVIDVVTEYIAGLIVEGNVLEADGALMAPGVAAKAVVTNEGTGQTHSANIVNGNYSLTFPEGEKALMKSGDKVVIEIRSVDGKILFGSSEHILTQAEIDANLLKVPDIKTDRVSTFTIKGKITDAQGKPIEGAVVSALSGEISTDANGEYALVLTDYATNPTIGQVVEVSGTVNPPTFPVTQMRKRAVTVTIDMIQKRVVEGTDISMAPIRIGGLTLNTSQLMNVIDKAVTMILPVSIRVLVEGNPQYKTMIDDMISSLGSIGSLVPMYLVLAPIDEPPKVFEQWQNMDLENFGNPIVPYPLYPLTEYLQALTGEFAGSLPLKVVGNKLDLYLLAPEYVGDVSFESALGPAQIERVTPGQKIPHRFQLEEELALIHLPAWPGMAGAASFSAFSGVTLYYTSGIAAPDDRSKFNLSVPMTEQIIDGKVVWTASPELELNKKYYYFFEVELKQPFSIFIGKEKREVSKWVMPDPRNMQGEDRGLFTALFRTPEWNAVFSPVAAAILAGQPIPTDAIPAIRDYLMAKSSEIIADILNDFDPRIVSEFKTPNISAGESLWLANFDVDDARDGDYEITVDVKDANGKLMDSLNVQLGVDRRVAPVTLSISNGQNTIGYFREDDNTHVFARAPEATAVSTVFLKASPGDPDTVGMLFQIMREGQTAWSTNNSVLALIIALAQCVDPELAKSLADGSVSPEEIKVLASKLSEADPGINALCASLSPESKADVKILLELFGQISADPTNLTSLLNLMNVKDFSGLMAFATKFADLSVSPIAFYGKTQVMLLPKEGNYRVRVVPFDSVLNAETSDVPARISVVPVEADIVKITQISLDVNGDGDVDDPKEKGDYSVEPPEPYTIFFADDEKATLTASIVYRTVNPFDVVFQYALQSAPDEWQDIKTVTWDALKGKQQGDTVEVDWVFGDELRTAFKNLFEANPEAVKNKQPLVFVRAVATNRLGVTDTSPYVADVLLDEVRAVSFSLLLRAGLSMFSIPLANSQASIADGAPVAIKKVSDLKTLLGEDTPVYYYSASGGKFEQAPVEMEITGDLSLITMLLEDTIVKFVGQGWPGKIDLVAGLNMFAVPLNANQKVSDLKALLGEGAPVYYYYRAEGKFQEATDDMPIEGGVGYITIMLEPKTISIDGIPWENEGVPPELLAAPSFFDPMSTLLMEVKGNVINANTDTAFNGLSVTVRHLSSNAVITDTTDDDGQFSAVFLDIFNNQSYRVGDVFKIDIHSNSGDIRFEPIQYTVTQEDVKLGRIILSNLTAKAIPKYSKLLQNWPNPFNPETWIPFQLSKDADVTLTIYDIQGRLVRRLDLGYIPAGIYSTKHNAIYWNGTNDFGERVSSGVYFYHIQAGGFSASRKMVILK